MRDLTMSELAWVSGAGDECSDEGGSGGDSDGGNTYGGVVDTTSIGDDIINVYEGLVAATSHIIERVAESF